MTRLKNQLDILDSTLQPKITIVWAWWVGSQVCHVLAKMGLNDITVIDFDEVEDHNVASQFYSSKDIGKPKVESLAENVKLFSDIEIKPLNRKWENDYSEITIIAVDNMDIRKEIVDYIHAQSDDFNSSFIIESRMWGTEYFVQCFDSYESYLPWVASRFPESEKDPENCTAKAIAFNTFIIAWLIWEQVSNYIMKRPIKHLITNQF